MKKILAVLLAVLLLVTLSVSAMALPSSQGQEVNKVVINHTNTGKSSATPEVKAIVKGDTVTLIPGKSTTLTFNGWAMFTDSAAKEIADETLDYELISVVKEDGSAAVLGVDYKKEDGKIVSLKNELLTITVKPLVETLYVSDLYEGVAVVFNMEAPKTGENANGVEIGLIALALLAAAAVVFTKKSVLDR